MAIRNWAKVTATLRIYSFSIFLSFGRIIFRSFFISLPRSASTEFIFFRWMPINRDPRVVSNFIRHFSLVPDIFRQYFRGRYLFFLSSSRRFFTMNSSACQINPRTKNSYEKFHFFFQVSKTFRLSTWAMASFSKSRDPERSRERFYGAEQRGEDLLSARPFSAPPCPS